MSETENFQTEDNPVVNEPEPTPAENQVTPAPKKGLFDKALPWVIVAIVFFLVGALITWFALYQPKVAELEAAQSEITASAETATQLQTQLDDVKSELATAKGDMVNAQATIEAQAAEIEAQKEVLAKTELLKVIYKFQSDVNVARAQLSKLDPASSRQALSFVVADLAELEKAGLEPDALSGLQAKIEEAQANLEIDPNKSLTAMELLYSNLLLLINNLQ